VPGDQPGGSWSGQATVNLKIWSSWGITLWFMTTIVTTTGTGTPIPNPDRAGAGTHVQCGDVRMQFDAGRMTLNRLAQMGTNVSELSAIFLTHYHSDHVVGLTDLLLTHWVMDGQDDWPAVPVVAPNGHTTEFLDRMFSIWDNDLAVRSLHNGRAAEPKALTVGFDVPDTPAEVWASGDVHVFAGQVRHEPVERAVGYRVETPDGVIVVSGDTKVCDEMAQLSQGADIVVYEAMRFDRIMERPPHMRYIMDYHADTREIGRQAKQLEIPTLMLTHLIPAPGNDGEKQSFVNDVREGGYEGEVIVCDDLSSVTLGV
jgi:ribonuclease Z